ncbi:MAG: cytochrome c family protein, partial [Proteobacteria bacterium]|nr:cytochrome c family protein [Pseudomonadota bacterium]
LASLQSCAECHPLAGSKDGKKIALETVFHKIGHQSSCIGCHLSKQQDKSCAGCHASITKSQKKESSTCLRCHLAPLPERTGVLATSKAAEMARMMPQLWQETFGTIYKVTVPEKIVIKDLVDRYEAVEYPHRKVFDTLVKQLQNSKLAQYFHSEETTLCLGCHHNTPAAGKPPKCGNCHGAPFDENHLHRPGIKASYHQQCMGCHQKMGIKEYLSCTACHKERKKDS